MTKFAPLLLALLFWQINPAAADPAITDPAKIEDQSWIVGKWELAYDPDGGKTDWVEFGSDGKVVSINADGRRIPGEYTVQGAEVKMVFRVQDYAIPMTFLHTPDNKKLLLYSDKTHHTAEYRKLN